MKKLLFFNLLLAMLLGATKAWAADDDLYCCGQKQASQYNWKYTTTNNIDGAIQMGSISYDAASKTVTFDGAYATVTGDNRIFYNKNVPGLKIVFKGYCRLRSDKCVFRLDKDTEMKGSTDRVEFMALGDNAECIYCPNETSLTISDFAQLRMTSKYWRAMNTNGTHVKVQNSNLSAEGADCAIQNNKGSDQVGHLELVECRMRDVWSIVFGSVGELYYKDSFDYVGYAVHTSKAKSVMIIRSEDCLGICLKGIELTKGWCECTDPTNPSYDIEDYYTYDESTNTLTLKKDLPAEPMSDELYDRWDGGPEIYSRYYKEFTTGIIARRRAITIDGGGHFVYGRLGMLCRSDVTLRNIIIGGNEDYGIEIYVGNAANNVTLTLKDNVIIGGVENAIYARHGHGDVVFNPSPGTTVQLFPCDKNFKVKSTFDDKPIRVNSTTLQDCYVSEPAGGGVGTSGIEVDGNTVFSKVVVTGRYDTYSLWVGETQVTSGNAHDILGDGGHFKYNASTKTLTVTNATLENPTIESNHGGISNYGIDGLTVNFVGTSNFNTYGNSIYSRKDITLAGNGSLTGMVSSSDYCGILLYDCACTIDGPQFDFTSPEEPVYSPTNNSVLNVMGGTTRLALHPGEGYRALYMPALNLGEGICITEPYGGYFSSGLHSITVDGTNAYKGDVLISSSSPHLETYDLWVGETQVTSGNAHDILGDGGHFKYDASTKTLTVTNATLVNPSSDYGHGGIHNCIDGLTVNFVGESTFDTYENSIYSQEDITLAGNGSLTATVSSSNHCAILLYGNTCTINGPQLDLTSEKEPIGDFTGTSTLNVMGSTTRIALHPDWPHDALKMSALNLGEGVFISEPIGGYFSPELHSITVDGTDAYSFDVIICGSDYFETYDLWVGETQVTSGNAADILGDGHFWYRASMKTLYVINATLENPTTDSNHGGITNYGIDGLTVYFSGKNTFDTYGNSIYSRKDITLFGDGSLTATVGSSDHCGILLYDCTCTINGPKLDFTAPEEPVYSATTSTLNVKGSTTRLVLHPGEGYRALCMPALNLGNNIYIMQPAGGYFSPDLWSITVDGTNAYKGDVIICNTNYGLWVGETQVSVFNASDILDDGGHFSYDDFTKTLTVNNATLENYCTDYYGHGGIHNYDIDGLTVNFVGESTFDTYGNSIDSYKDITLSGNGSLTATVTSSDWTGLVLHDCTCTINGPQLDITAPVEPIFNHPANPSTLNVIGSTTRLALHPDEGYCAMFLSALNLGEGLCITEPIDGYFSPDLHGITVDGTNAYEGDVIIGNEHGSKLGFSINDVEMTTANMDNVPGLVSGSAHIETSETGEPILVLDNATLEWNTTGYGLYNHDTGSNGLTLRVLGDCTIKAPNTIALELDVATTTAISGGGTLHIISGSYPIETWVASTLRIQDATTVIAKSETGRSALWDQDGAYIEIMDGGVFAAFGKYEPIWLDSNGEFILGEGIALRYPSDAYIGSNNNIYYADGTEVTNDWVVFGPDNEATQDLITGVDEIASSKQPTDNGFIYNAAGQQIVNGTPRLQSRLGSKESKKWSNGKLPKGVYIQNGKKVLR